MKIDLVLPQPEDAGLWLKVRGQKSTQEKNPIGILSEEKLREQIAASNSPISEKKAAHRYFIQDTSRNFAGVISLKDINWESGVCEIGYLIAEDYQGKGVATEAVRLILKKAFEAGIKKVKATTSVKNAASYRVLQKNGIRPARISDCQTIHRLSHQLGYGPTIEEVESHLAQILAHPDYEVVVIEKSGEVVGWMSLYKRLRIEDVEFLQVAAVVTDERCRSQGLGKLLMNFADERAKSLGLSFVGLHSGKRRDQAHKFYEKIGYTKAKESYFFKKDLAQI